MERALQFALAAALTRLAAPLQFGADASVLLLTTGLLLIFFELNRPGSVLPGAAGLLLALLATASIFRLHPAPQGLLLLATAVLLLLLDLLRPTSLLLALGATLALIFGFLRLLPAANPLPPALSTASHAAIHPATAIPCGLVLGAGTSLLTRLARRARANKGLDLERARTSRPGAFKS